MSWMKAETKEKLPGAHKNIKELLNRMDLVSYIIENPGAEVLDIREKFGYAQHTASTYLPALVRAGFLIEKRYADLGLTSKNGNYKKYYAKHRRLSRVGKLCKELNRK